MHVGMRGMLVGAVVLLLIACDDEGSTRDDGGLEPDAAPTVDGNGGTGSVDWFEDFRTSLTDKGLVFNISSGSTTVNRVSASGLGFAAGLTHVAHNFHDGEGTVGYEALNLWPAPTTDQSVFFRMLVRNDMPAGANIGPFEHGFQSNVGEVEVAWQYDSGDSDSFNIYGFTWNGSQGVLLCDAPKATVLRLEWRWRKLSSTTGDAAFRVYNNQSGALLGQVAGEATTGLTDANYRAFLFGIAGLAGATYVGNGIYWGAIAVRVSSDADAWIGAYPASNEL